MLIKSLWMVLLFLLVTNCYAEDELQQDLAGIHFFPESIVFWNVAEGDTPEKKLFIRQADNHRLMIDSVSGMGEGITVELAEKSGLERMAYTINVKLNPLSAGSAVEDAVIVETDHPDHPTLKIPVRANILDGILLDPPSFGMVVNRKTRLATGAIQISSIDNTEFEISSVSTSLPTMYTQIVPMEQCCGYYIAVLLNDVEGRVDKPQQATIHVNTTSKQGTIVIPVMLRPSSSM